MTTMERMVSNELALGWRDLATRDLLDEQEHWQWLLAEAASDPAVAYPAETVAYCRHQLAGIEAELGRRQRLRSRPEAPAWPASRDRRAELDAIKARLSVADFLQRYTVAELQRRGDRYVTHCMLPGHAAEATPSFVIYPGDRGWYCFGCQRGGDLFDLARQVLGIARFGDVVEVLASGVECRPAHGGELPQAEGSERPAAPARGDPPRPGSPPPELRAMVHTLGGGRMDVTPATTLTVAGQTLIIRRQRGGKRRV